MAVGLSGDNLEIEKIMVRKENARNNFGRYVVSSKDKVQSRGS